MAVKVRFFASLREQVGSAGCEIPFSAELTPAKIWLLATKEQSMPTKLLIAINQEYATLADSIREGDEVAFFPPVTGG